MRRIGLLVAALGLAGCGEQAMPPPPSLPAATTMTAPPPVSESVAVKPLSSGNTCAVVPADLRRALDVPSAGVPSTQGSTETCRWEESATGLGLVVGVEPERDPLESAYDREGARVAEVGGFPAIELALEPQHVCNIYVKTAATQGFWVIYGALDRELDACAGARTVAEHLAERVRRASR